MSGISSKTQTRLPIPAVTWETHTWAPRSHSAAALGVSARELRRQAGDYQSAGPATLTPWHPSISGPLGTDIDEATQELVTFDNYGAQRLGKDAAALGPMSAILLRTESGSSSEIEQLTSGAKQLALAELNERSGANAQAVVGNVRAMEAALDLASEVSEATVLAMHQGLLSRHSGLNEHAGRYRRELVWVGPGVAGPLAADFVAAQPELIGPAMDDLMTFADRADLPALMQIAVAHAQFETIHPFVDGNGRTGRALAHAMLRNKGLVNNITTPLSAGLLTDTDSYFDALTAFRSGDAGPITERFAFAARFAALTGRELVDRLAEQLEEARHRLTGVRSDSKAHQILPLLIAHPVVNSHFLRQQLGLSAPGVHRALATLVDRSVLIKTSSRTRNQVWQHPGILAVLDEYAAKVRRSRPGALWS